MPLWQCLVNCDEDENGLSNYEDNPLEYISEALYEKRTATREKVRPEIAVSLRFAALLNLTDTFVAFVFPRLSRVALPGAGRGPPRPRAEDMWPPVLRDRPVLPRLFQLPVRAAR